MEAIIIALTYLSPSDIRNPLLVNLGDRRLRQIAHKKVFREVRVGSEPYDASDCTKAIDTSAAGKVGGVLVSRVAIVLYLISAVGKTGGGFTHFTGSRGHIRIRPRHEHGGTFFFFPHTSTFQLLDKQWSQVSSLLSPGSSLPIRNAHRFQQSHCWTSSGHRCRPFSPPVLAFQFVTRIGFSNPTARRFFIECC